MLQMSLLNGKKAQQWTGTRFWIKEATSYDWNYRTAPKQEELLIPTEVKNNLLIISQKVLFKSYNNEE